jgi:starch phosphorylase
VAARLNGLDPGDVVVEMLMGLFAKREKSHEPMHYSFKATRAMTEEGENIFALEVKPEQCGKLEYHIRAYPYHKMLTHPFEMGMMRWL